MTKTNIQEHLGWLLRLSPILAPPAIPTSSTGIQAQANPEPPNTTILEPQGSTREPPNVQLGLPSPNSDSGIEILSNDSEPKANAVFARPVLPDKVLKRQEEMARLAYAPGKQKRPTLLSRNDGHGSKQAGSLQESYNAELSRRTGTGEDGRSTSRKVDAQEHTSMAVGTDSESQASSSSIVEEFGDTRILWTESSASRAAPPNYAGKKRKSSEMTRDEPTTIQTPKRSASPDSLLLEGFSPPMKKKTPAQREKAFSMASHQAQNKSAARPSSKPFDKSTQVSKPLPVDRPTEDTVPHLEGSQTPRAMTQIRAVKQTPRDIVADSEDEDMAFEIDTHEASSNQKAAVKGGHEVSLYPGLTKSGFTTGESQTSPHKMNPRTSPNSRAKRSQLNEGKVTTSKLDNDSPLPAPLTTLPSATVPLTVTGSGGPSSSVKSDGFPSTIRGTVLEDFLKEDPKQIQDQLQDLKAQQAIIATSISNINWLAELRQRHEDVNKRQKSLRRILAAAYSEDTDPKEETIADERQLRSELKNIEAELIQALSHTTTGALPAGSQALASISGPRSNVNPDAGAVMVHSTQTLSPLQAVEPLHLDNASNSAQTSFVQQTQKHRDEHSHNVGLRDTDSNLIIPVAVRRPDPNVNTTRQPSMPPFQSHYPADLQQEEDFGDAEDEIAMLEAANRIDEPRKRSPAKVHLQGRSALTEIAGNLPGPPTVHDMYSVTEAPPANQARHRWTQEVYRVLKSRFKLQGFRPNQLAAINATLSGKDVFVLMPTGGGKSLCYQLPAAVQSGTTKGITLVVSPLLSLMQDQIDHLQGLGIQAMAVSSQVSQDKRRNILNALRGPHPERFVQLLYVSPEMINLNQNFVDALQDVHQRQRLARIVIDEAHCVSQWGHDFRKDYTAIGSIRGKFPGVPIMALTATATENVMVDVTHNLRMLGCEKFSQSFNRPNLYYSVERKARAAAVLDRLVDIIKEKHHRQSGIVYCLSRKTCEVVAEQLRKRKINAEHYHAKLSTEEKTAVQQGWQAGEHQVIVATIAFGMGIDKPDVRFVIHHSIPKSLEGYYQETGRAGRDGKNSACYLFYGYHDIRTLQKMIDDGEGSYEQKDRQHQMLRKIKQFCENNNDCRRVQVLSYFNENFDKAKCDKRCDNCNSTEGLRDLDLTDYAIDAVNLVMLLERRKLKLTVLQCADVFRGANTKKIKDMKLWELEYYGRGEDLKRGDPERIFYQLIRDRILKEDHDLNQAGFATTYLELGDKEPVESLLQHRRKVLFQTSSITQQFVPQQSVPKPKKTAKSKGKKAAAKAHPPSTNVSSPVQTSRRRVQETYEDEDEERAYQFEDDYEDDGFVVDDNEEDSEDGFEPKRIARLNTKDLPNSIGPPITSDQMLEELGEIHQGIVEEFVREAEQEARKIQISSSRRGALFTQTALRWMAIKFPKNKKELLQIPGINQEMAKTHARRFLELIHKAKSHLDEVTDQGQDETPYDPNHQIIEISDDENVQCDFESEASGNDRVWGEKSSYFHPPQNLQAVNQQFSHASRLHESAGPRLKGSDRGEGTSGLNGKTEASKKSSSKPRKRPAILNGGTFGAMPI